MTYHCKLLFLCLVQEESKFCHNHLAEDWCNFLLLFECHLHSFWNILYILTIHCSFHLFLIGQNKEDFANFTTECIFLIRSWIQAQGITDITLKENSRILETGMGFWLRKNLKMSLDVSVCCFMGWDGLFPRNLEPNYKFFEQRENFG